MEIQSDEGARARAKREQVLEAAYRVFLREGFAATSTDVLAQEAGVSKRTLYAYYPSKEDLFVDVVRRLTLENPQTRVLDFIQGLKPRQPEELREALLALAQKVIATMMQPGNLALLRTILADSHRFPQLTEILRLTVPERATVEVSRMLERARENGVAIKQGNIEVMARLFIGPLLSYVVFDGLLRPQDQTQQPGAETIKELVNLFIWAIIQESDSERKEQ